MDKEEAIDILKNCIADYVIGDFCVGKFCPMEKECKDKECVFEQAIDIVSNYIEELEKREIWSTATIKGLKEDFIPKQKIRDKIEELENLIKEAHKELGSASKEFTIYVSQEKILKELLEEEK